MKTLYWVVISILFVIGCYLIIVGTKLETINKNTVLISMPSPTPQLINEQRLFNLVQNWRIKNNLQPYIKSTVLCNIAKKRIVEISKDFSHNGFWKYGKDKSIGENLVYMPNDLHLSIDLNEASLTSWLHSASHTANLKRNFTKSCLKSDGKFAVQIFGYF